MVEERTALLEFIEKIEQLNQFQDKIDTPSSINQIWEVFLADIGNLVKTQACALFLVDEDTHEFVLKHASPQDKGSIFRKEAGLQIDCGMFSWVINRRQPALLPALALDGDTSIVMLPLTTNRKTLGAVLVLTPIKESSITRENLKLLTMLVKQCSLVMENTLLYENLVKEHASLQRANEEIRVLSITDPLTGSFNRGYLTEYLPQEIRRARRYNRHLSLALADIDNFKEVNDTYGHQAGDSVLKEFVRRSKEVIRAKMDWIARYGGEEFLFVLPETNIEGAGLMAERLRANFARTVIKVRGNEIRITSSFGVTGLGPDTPDDKISPEYIISMADRCLYRAKARGKNRVVTDSLAGSVI